VTRVRVDVTGPMLAPSRNLVIRLRGALARVAPQAFVERLGLLYHKIVKRTAVEPSLLRRLKADLLFCPFTALAFHDSSIPAVSVVYDLQHRYYPEFFDAVDRRQRERGFQDACREAKCVVCISEFVRRAILENAEIVPARIVVIPILMPNRLARPTAAKIRETLCSLGLAEDGFLLYPANFWRHKNHERLLEAFRLYLAGNPDSRRKLVLTGAPGPGRDFILQACSSDPLLSNRVLCPGYLPNEQFATLLYGCWALVFPSLFEGFGMPLLEAMAAAKPMLLSNRTSLPEIGGEAALYFDPDQPAEIAAVISRLDNTPDLHAELAAKAANRLGAFGDAEEMALRYLAVLGDPTGSARLGGAAKVE